MVFGSSHFNHTKIIHMHAAGQLEKQGTGNGKRERERETGTKNEKLIVLGSSPHFPNEYVNVPGRLGTRLLSG